MVAVDFTTQTAPIAGCARKEFQSIAHMRDWFRSYFFSNTYRVRGPERAIYDDHGQLLGYYEGAT